jgi:hypothetical protein
MKKFFPRFQLHSPLFKGSGHSCLLNIKTYNSLHQIYKGREKGSKVQRVKGLKKAIMIVLRIIEILVLIILMNSVYSDIFNKTCVREFRRDIPETMKSSMFQSVIKTGIIRKDLLNLKIHTVLLNKPFNLETFEPLNFALSKAKRDGSISETHLQFLRHFCLNF